MVWGKMEEAVDDNLKHLPKQLLDRHVELQRQLDKKKEERLESGKMHAEINYFFEMFDDKTRDINGTLEKLTSGLVENERLPDYFDRISKDIQSLNKYLSTSSSFLRVFNIRKCKETLEELTVRSKILEDELLPRKKFGFKSKSNKVISSNQKSSTSPDKKILFSDDEVDSIKNIKWKLDIGLSSCGFSQRTGEYLKLEASEVNGKDVALSSLTDCTVVLSGAPSTLHIAHVDKCHVFCGPVSTSVFVDRCNNCTLVFPCQQLRIHHTTKSDFYIHVTSRAIIEDSTQIQVAPFNWNYSDLEDHFCVSGLDTKRNNWSVVDDFNWLAQDQPSPNWKVMDEATRIIEWDLCHFKT